MITLSTARAIPRILLLDKAQKRGSTERYEQALEISPIQSIHTKCGESKYNYIDGH